jgi:hypothetical protein
MAENLQRSRGRPGSYKLDRGGFPTETGPFIGEVMNNHDPSRIGRVQVYIPEFGTGDKTDSSSWRTVRYLSPFFGSTQHSGTSNGTGGYVGNPHSYGMWFTVPDIGNKVLCFFVSGDQNQGYYVGSIPDPDLMHMVPAVGASSQYQINNNQEAQKYAGAPRLPVAEINNENTEVREDPRSFDQPRPVHSYTAAVMYQQGLIKDSVRGPIGSSAYRESPSATFGISTPGRPNYESGASEYNIKQSLASGATTKDDVKVIGRRGGHSIVMDDGDITGNDNLVRIRTGKGHQILLSDDGNCVHIIHANGQSWVELGKEGTVDVYAANSVNLRSQGDLNLHADQNVNIYAGQSLNLHSKKATILNSEGIVSLLGEKSVNMYSTKAISVKSDGSLALSGTVAASLDSTGPTAVNGAFVLLNTGPSLPTAPPVYAARTKLPETKHSENGWNSTEGLLDSIVTRAPTHEPYVHHNKGVPTNVQYDGAGAVPASEEVVNKMNEVAEIGVRSDE